MSAIFRLSIFCIALATIASAKYVPARVKKFDNITVVNDVREVIAKHPDMKLTPLARKEGIAPKMATNYIVGGRIKGDELLSASLGDVFDTPNVKIPLSYPENGTGSVLTYVEMQITQSNDNGNAYLAAGGIGQRFITIIVEAENTEYFSFVIKYYGLV